MKIHQKNRTFELSHECSKVRFFRRFFASLKDACNKKGEIPTGDGLPPSSQPTLSGVTDPAVEIDPTIAGQRFS